ELRGRELDVAHRLDRGDEAGAVDRARLLDRLEQRVQAVGGRLLAARGQLVEVLLHPPGDGELGEVHEAADVPGRDRARLGRVLGEVGPAVVAGAAWGPEDVRVPALRRVLGGGRVDVRRAQLVDLDDEV